MATADRTLVLADEGGEVQKFTVVEESGRGGRNAPARKMSGSYVYLFQDRLAEIAADRGLIGRDFRVLLAVLGRATYESPIFDSDPAGIAAELAISRHEVQLALAALAEKELILRPRRGKIALEPTFAWRGSTQGRANRLKEEA